MVANEGVRDSGAAAPSLLASSPARFLRAMARHDCRNNDYNHICQRRATPTRPLQPQGSTMTWASVYFNPCRTAWRQKSPRLRAEGQHIASRLPRTSNTVTHTALNTGRLIIYDSDSSFPLRLGSSALASTALMDYCPGRGSVLIGQNRTAAGAPCAWDTMKALRRNGWRLLANDAHFKAATFGPSA